MQIERFSTKMKQCWIKTIRALFVLTAISLTAACQYDFKDYDYEYDSLKVGIYAGGVQTRTEMLPDGLSAVWSAGDELAVWAKPSSGDYELSQQKFTTYGIDGKRGFFTSVLDEAMPDATYTYYCTYPYPESVSGTSAIFNLPPVQDGKVTGGADIMVAVPVTYGPLAPVPDPEDHSGMSMRMTRMMHQFRFYVPQDDEMLGDAEINKIKLTFPRKVTGEVSVDYTDPSKQAELTAPSGEDITLELAEPIGVSYERNYEYACVAIPPTAFSLGEKLGLKAYTDEHIVIFDDIDLCARTFAAGLSTPVRLKIKEMRDYYKVRFTVTANNLGENPESITLTAPAGCKWSDTGSDIYTYSTGAEIPVGTSFELRFEDPDAYESLSKKKVTVMFDSEHAVTYQEITMPDMSSGSSVHMNLTVPYLLYQDFRSASYTESNDGYEPSANSNQNTDGILLDNYGLAGWNASRFRISEGNSIRIGVRYESGAWVPGRYCGRLDTPALGALKSGADACIKVTFDYGCYIPNKGYDGTEIVWEGWSPTTVTKYFDDSQNYVLSCKVGYHTEAEGSALKGANQGSIDDKFTAVTTFGPHKTEMGSLDFASNFPHQGANFTIDGADASTRICWWALTAQETSSLARNCHYYIYIDNIKIQIAN